MADLLPAGTVILNEDFTEYTELPEDGNHEGASPESTNGKEAELHFKSGLKVTCDILVGADGISSKVSAQAFGDPKIFHTGARVWLGWCDWIDTIPSGAGICHHSWQYQASYFAMVNHGHKSLQWWPVEASSEGDPAPKTVEDRRKHFDIILEDFCEPMPSVIGNTNLETDLFCWEVYQRPSLKKWSNGRVVCLGDAVHPVSPYAAYGMGMAIEDGYFLGKALDGVDLKDMQQVEKGFKAFEAQRVDYVNGNFEFARNLGTIFHRLPWPVASGQSQGLGI